MRQLVHEDHCLSFLEGWNFSLQFRSFFSFCKTQHNTTNNQQTVFCCLETRSYCIAQDSLKLNCVAQADPGLVVASLPQFPKWWDYRFKLCACFLSVISIHVLPEAHKFCLAPCVREVPLIRECPEGQTVVSGLFLQGSITEKPEGTIE